MIDTAAPRNRTTTTRAPGSGITFRDVPPPAPLAPWVASCWSLRVADDSSAVSCTITPDGCAHLVIHAGRVMFAGPRTSPAQRPVRRGATWFGIRFHPGAARSLLPLRGIPTLNAVDLDAATIPGLVPFVVAAATLDTSRALDELAVDAGLLLGGFIASGVLPDPMVSRAVRALQIERPTPTVAELSARAGLSTRQFRRRFTAAVELSPREYSRVVRFRRCVLDLLGAQTTQWAAHAVQHGFADQSHLIREFRRLGGWAPNELSARLHNVAHRAVWNPAAPAAPTS